MLLKTMMYVGGGIHVGKEVIENKEKYRLPYGMPWSDPIADFNLNDIEWKEKGKKK